jgi:uncharacterized protein (DUF952 family)
MTDNIAYKILTADQAEALRQNTFAGAPIDLADGYIHLSTAAQLTETLNKHFASQTSLWVAAIDLTSLTATLRWEPSRGGALFPHLYGSLTMQAVLTLHPLETDADGAVRPPGTPRG